MGKRTVGRIIVKHTQFPLFDNTKTVDLATLLHPMGTDPYRRFRDQLRNSFYREVGTSSIAGLISTYCYRHPTNTVYLESVESLLRSHGWRTYTFLLVADKATLLSRVKGTERRDKHTLHREQDLSSWLASSPKCNVPPFPACVVIETTHLSATEVAEIVMEKAEVPNAAEGSA